MRIAGENCSGNVGHLTSALVAGDVMPALNSDASSTMPSDLIKDARKQILPGRANRKLRGYVAEVKELHEAGYTISGIQQVLALSGIPVSRATIAREVSRLASAAPTAPPKVAPTAPEKTSTETVTVTVNS